LGLALAAALAVRLALGRRSGCTLDLSNKRRGQSAVTVARVGVSGVLWDVDVVLVFLLLLLVLDFLVLGRLVSVVS
jgi:hypothetical protein